MSNAHSHNYVSESLTNCKKPTMTISRHNNDKSGISNNNSNNVTSNNGINNVGHDVPGLATSNALKNKNFKVSIEILFHLYRAFAGTVRLEEVRNFVECYSEKISMFQSKSQTIGYYANLDILSCPVCFGILVDPVTTQCGHSYCKKCLQKESVGQCCKRCKSALTSVDITKSKLNVVLGALIEKWWARDIQAATFRNEGNSLFASQNGEDSLEKYSQALNLVPDDHLSLGNRSHVLLTLGRSEEALVDIDAAIKICPSWTKGYFRKAAVLKALGRYEEAFVNLSTCLCLVNAHDQASAGPVKNEMVKVLHKIFLQAAGALGNVSVRCHNFDQHQYSPFPNTNKRERSARDESDSEYSSSGDEMERERKVPRKHSSDTKVKTKTKKNTTINHTNNHDPQLNKIHRLFDRANSELLRIQNDMLDLRTKNNNSNSNNNSNGNTTSNSTNNSNNVTITINRPVDVSLISVNDLECTLCYRLLHQPVTTMCGHTYCRSCLERSLDHSPSCPLCKTSLQDYLAHRRHTVTQILDIAITQYLPQEHTERVQQHLDEIAEVISLGKSSTAEIPIFVCTMAFPTVPCPLHVFEPRYRLMIRRCVESGGKHFGMCAYMEDAEQNYADYGTLLEIKNVQYFADGRSVVETIGRRRFKVLSRSQKDGYNVACIEMLQDHAIADSLLQVQEIHDQVYSEATEWLRTINQVLRQRIHTHFGPMPGPEENWWLLENDGPAWIWWLLAILPLDTKAQITILSMNSLQKRLESIQKVLKYVKTQI